MRRLGRPSPCFGRPLKGTSVFQGTSGRPSEKALLVMSGGPTRTLHRFHCLRLLVSSGVVVVTQEQIPTKTKGCLQDPCWLFQGGPCSATKSRATGSSPGLCIRGAGNSVPGHCSQGCLFEPLLLPKGTQITGALPALLPPDCLPLTLPSLSVQHTVVPKRQSFAALKGWTVPDSDISPCLWSIIPR